MPCSYYIYYRVDPAKAAATERRIRELIEGMRKATGVHGRLMKKRHEPNLWMEIYENVSDEAKFEWELAEAVDHLKIRELLLPGTPRHIECFEEP
jgi:quinol monooxygenase YgiN